MGTKRMSRTARRSTVRLDDISGGDVLRLCFGWSPPRNDFDRSRTRWADWASFLADYRELRDEFLGSGWPVAGTEPFCEWLWLKTGGDAANVAALEAEGDALTAEARVRYPTRVINGVAALYRYQTRGRWGSGVSEYAEAVVEARRDG